MLIIYKKYYALVLYCDCQTGMNKLTEEAQNILDARIVIETFVVGKVDQKYCKYFRQKMVDNVKTNGENI